MILNMIFPILLLQASIMIVKPDFDGVRFKGSLERVINEKPCVRLFTNNGDMGCRTTNKDGTIGAFYEIRSPDDIIRAKNLDFDFTILMGGEYFNPNYLSELSSTGKLKGVVVIDTGVSWTEASYGKYSVDSSSPQGLGTYQEQFSIGPEYTWNEYGNGLSYLSYNFPIVRADIAEYDNLKKYCQQNRDVNYASSARLNLAQFSYYLGGEGVTSQECLEWTNMYGYREPHCLPVGGLSVWATAETLDNRNKVLATVAIDSTAAFHDLALGANDAVASIVALLTAAEAISRVDTSVLGKQPMFLLANTEEWGYAGSRRFVKDLIDFECNNVVSGEETRHGLPLCASPVYPTTLFEWILGSGAQISSILALDQIGNCNGDFTVHSINHGDEESVSSTVLNIAGNMDGVSISAGETGTIPPTPLTSFEREYNALGASFTGAVLAGYGSSFNNPYYHTRLDNASVVNEKDIIKAAQITVLSVLTLCGGENIPSINTTLVSILLDCLLTDWSCEYMSEYNRIEERNVGDTASAGGISFGTASSPPSYYTSVLNAAGSGGGQPVVSSQGYLYGRFDGTWRSKKDSAFAIPNQLEAFLRSFLARHLSTPVNINYQNDQQTDSEGDDGGGGGGGG
eukprot:CAMPEP_0182439590 /NCGR_PEP_ID=MMETSP1167-20130531/86531_1 /TAXON_ID=2988 /ORGANISM="Mallomonas Sp, Strain CCMP3275" /LENGTH=626 /DNA_ID=CAMNT_0024633325 /DNA_START=201 /DNA_END=2077 /DNA_ORIENTATION=+